jgi:predicted dehydrogenase
MILDMMCHWRYVLDNLFGQVQSITCLGAGTSTSAGTKPANRMRATADDAAYATAQLKGHNGEPVVAQLTMSWATRVRRDDLVTFHVDGTHGSAVAGPAGLPRAEPRGHAAPGVEPRREAGHELLRAVAGGARHPGVRQRLQAAVGGLHPPCGRRRALCWTLPEGAKGVQLVEAALQSWKERRWVDVPPLGI